MTSPEPAPLPETLHEVIAQVLRDGNPKDIARRLGRSLYTVLHWGNDPETGAHPIPANKIIPFCLAARDSRPIEWLSQQAGGVFVRVPESPVSLASASKKMADLSREFSDVMRGFALAISDGEFSAKETRQMRRELDEMITQAVRFRAALR